MNEVQQELDTLQKEIREEIETLEAEIEREKSKGVVMKFSPELLKRLKVLTQELEGV